jgi:tryptophan halogenase
VAETLADCLGAVQPSAIAQYNKRHAREWDAIRRFLGIHYRFNNRFNTPFWQECWQHCELCGAEEMVEYYRENGPSALWRSELLGPQDQFGMEGYLSMLVGQKVPYKLHHNATAEEGTNWRRINEAIREKVVPAFSVAEALQVIRSPYWTWPSGIHPMPVAPLR